MKNKIIYALVLFLTLCSCEKEKIRVSGITLDSTAMTLIVGDTRTLAATLSPADAENQMVLWSSEDASVAEVRDGMVRAVAPGVVLIVAKSDDDGSISASCKVTVLTDIVPVEGVVLEPGTLTMKKGDIVDTLKVSVIPADASIRDLRWVSTDEDIVTVDDDGKLTAERPGEADIVVTTVDGGFTASCRVLVRQDGAGLYLSTHELSLNEYEQEQIKVTITPEDATDQNVRWESSDEAVAIVTYGNYVYAKKAGTALIVASVGDGTLADTCIVTVRCPVKGVSLPDRTLTLKKGEEKQLVATVYPERATDPSVSWTSSDASVVSVSADGKLKALAPGRSATIVVTTADGAHTASCTVTVEDDVTGISLGDAEKKLVMHQTFLLTATVHTDDPTKGAITWYSDDKDIASVDDKGLVTAHKVGHTEIHATTVVGGYLATCKVQVQETVVTISPEFPVLYCGYDDKGIRLSATIAPDYAAGLGVWEWTSSAPGIAAVSSDGVVTPVDRGTAKITARLGEYGKESIEVTVKRLVDEMYLEPKETELWIGGTDDERSLEIAVKGKPENADIPDWSVSGFDNRLVSCDEADGKIKITARDLVGKTKLTVGPVEKRFNIAPAECSIEISRHVGSVSLAPATGTVYVDEEPLVITATVAPADAKNKKVVWSSFDENIAVVVQDGTVGTDGKVRARVTARKAGNVTITVTTDDLRKTAECRVTVVDRRVTGVTVSPENLTLNVGDVANLTATVEPANAKNKNVSWSSSAPGIAAVDQNGNVTAVKAGTAVITVTTEEGKYKATSVVTVEDKRVTGVTVTPATLTLYEGSSETLTATVTPADAKNKKVSWSSSAPGVAAVDQNGNVTAVKAGTATITVTTEDGGHQASCKVTVEGKKVTGVTVNHQTLTLYEGASETLTATVTPADAKNRNVSWKSSDTSVASVDQSGKVTAVKAGTATITVTTEDGGYQATCRVTVNEDRRVTGVKVSPSTATMYVGDSRTLVATVEPANAENKNVSWTSSDTSVASVDQSGKVTAVKAGSATITVTTAEGGHKATCDITVQVAVTSITLSQTSARLAYGNTLTLTASVKPDAATNKGVTWTSSDPTVATVSSGLVTARSKTGTAVITATSVDNPNLSASCTVSVVSQIVPVSGISVTPYPLNIYLGQTAQLTATVTPANATDKSVTWWAQQGGVASVDQNGVVTPLKEGSTRVFAETNDGGYSTSVPVTVSKNTVASVTLPLPKIVLKVGEKYELSARITGNDPAAPASNPTVRWTSSSGTVATVEQISVSKSGNVVTAVGRVKAMKAGTAIIKVVSVDDPGKEATCELVVLSGGSSSGGNEGAEFDDWNF